MSTKTEYIAGMKVLRQIGKGGMSEVYEVEDVRLGVRRAVKVYSCAKDSPEIRARFEVEGQLLAKLNHPRIVRVVDYGVDPDLDKPFFVMDLVQDVDGKIRSLADVQAGEVDEAIVGRWYDDIREGLAYIHGKGVIHRDLKLQNILVGPDGHVVITDFGISRVFKPSDGNETIVDPVQTIVNMRDGKSPVMGSVGYMAPELEMGASATEKSDWYALGVIVYRLLTGTWCDARTNMADMLSTYDPVWMRLLPGLLHSNPAGRKCLSYDVERAKLLSDDQLRQENELLQLQERLGKEKENGALAVSRLEKMISVWKRRCCLMTVCAAAITVGLGAVMLAVKVRLDVPSFDAVFFIPPSAPDEDTDEMPSRETFRQSMFDALALTHSVFLDMKKGLVTRDKARKMLLDMSARAKNDDFNLFSSLPDSYSQCGDTQALAILLENAGERLK